MADPIRVTRVSRRRERLAMLALIATALNAPLAQAQTGNAGASDAAGASTKLSVSDQQFVQDAGQAGATEIAASKLALKNSSDAQVKRFAQRMIADHTRLAHELDMVVKPHGMSAPPSADSSVVGSLEKLKGPDFDKAYLQKVAVGGHQKAVELFRKESESGNDAQLKSAAAKALPVIEHHYAMAQQLAQAKGVS